jgi:hypothetical membrane protein
MKKIDFYIHKLYYFLPGGLYGLFASMIRIYGDVMAILSYPGYTPTIHMISFLGGGPGHLFFNLGLFFSAIMSIPYYISFANIFVNELPEEKKIIRRSLKVSIISAISICLVGFFLELSTIVPNRFIYDLHAFFAIIAFLCGAYSCIISGLLIKKSTRFPKLFAYICYTVAGLNLLFLFTWHALVEWLAAYFFIVMQILFCFYIILKKM